ncbi:hypothetical protein [Paucimonas lemoignei]|uniref:hypothetical protein n=1 Tax=Paucimonas lemoignei TaxID=29443 RepID=UPI001FB4D7B7|nr:hypothetical protein [Paucimonas lemoignei]
MAYLQRTRKLTMPRPIKTSLPEAKLKFINVPVTNETATGLAHLKESMGASSQGEVIEKMVRICLAIENAAKK